MLVEMRPDDVYKQIMEKIDGFDSKGTRFASYQATEAMINHLTASWQRYVSHALPAYPLHFSGKGIVTCAGGIRYFTCAWVSIRSLRQQGCMLPIELWYTDGELNEEVISELQAWDVTCKNAHQYTSSPVQGYALKPFAILHSSFKEILFLDADNNCLADPSYLFEQEDYQKHGAVFWPDFWKTDPENPIWKITNSTDYQEYEQESGQILIDKERCWAAINLCMYFNQQREIYYNFLLGDKDTFKFAWKALKQPYTMISAEVGFCGYAATSNPLLCKGIAMVQHDFEGNILFIHQNLVKWDIVKDEEQLWEKIKRFKPDSTNRIFIQQLISLSKERTVLTFDIAGEVSTLNTPPWLLEKESICLQILKDLRQAGFYLRFILYLYQSRLRGDTQPSPLKHSH